MTEGIFSGTDMMKNMSKWIMGLLLFCSILVSAFNIQENTLGFSDDNFFSKFQMDSEALVLGGILADRGGVQDRYWQLGFIAEDGHFDYSKDVLDAYKIFSNEKLPASLGFSPYGSQVGLQGVFFSKISSFIGSRSISSLQWINSLLLAVVIWALAYLYGRVFNFTFAVVFLVTLLSSPWLIAFGRNLYWVSFLWFLPSVFSGLLYCESRPSVQKILIFGIGFSIFLKSLCGYEYLSSIVLLSVSFFVVGPVFSKNIDFERYRKNIKMAFSVFITSVVGFLVAFVLHSIKRGGVFSGAADIIKKDILRRTYGNPSDFGPLYADSLSSSVFDVVTTYVFHWKTAIFFWQPGSYFGYLILLVFFVIIYQLITSRMVGLRNIVLVVFFLLVPCSWFVLAKGHSFIHTHMNYVLWYFGFMSAIVYVLVDFFIIKIGRLLRMTKGV